MPTDPQVQDPDKEDIPAEPGKKGMTFKAPARLYDQVNKLAATKGVFVTEVLTEAVEAYFKPNPLQEQLDALTAQVNNYLGLENELTEAREKLAVAEYDLEKLQLSIADSGSTQQQQNARIAELERQIDEYKTAASAAANTLQSTRNDLSQAKAQRDKYKQELQEAKSVGSIEKLTLNQTKTAIQQEVNNLGDLAIRSAFISEKSVLKVAPSYVPRKQRK